MELLSLSFFGGFRAERNGRPITAFESNTVRAHGVQRDPVHPDGACLAAGGYDCVVRLFELETGRVLNELHGHSRGVEVVQFRPDGRILATASGDETIRIWDVTPGVAGACVATLRTSRPYARMNIAGATGMTAGQRLALTALGAVDGGSVNAGVQR